MFSSEPRTSDTLSQIPMMPHTYLCQVSTYVFLQGLDRLTRRTGISDRVYGMRYLLCEPMMQPYYMIKLTCYPELRSVLWGMLTKTLLCSEPAGSSQGVHDGSTGQEDGSGQLLPSKQRYGLFHCLPTNRVGVIVFPATSPNPHLAPADLLVKRYPNVFPHRHLITTPPCPTNRDPL